MATVDIEMIAKQLLEELTKEQLTSEAFDKGMRHGVIVFYGRIQKAAAAASSSEPGGETPAGASEGDSTSEAPREPSERTGI